MNDLSFVTYTNNNCKDIWKPYFHSLDFYATNIKSYVFSDVVCEEFQNHKFLSYVEEKNYCQEFNRLLDNVDTKYFIYMQEDFILYNKINIDKINKYISVLDKTDFSYVRLIKCGDITNIKYEDDLYLVSKDNKSNFSINSFSMQPTIWKKEDFIDLYESTNRQRFGEHIEYSMAMNSLGINGLYSYNGEKKRGGNHHDSEVFPYIATAIVKGKWNISEYPEEIEVILRDFKIDKNLRGVC